jgi:hypothetical protein
VPTGDIAYLRVHHDDSLWAQVRDLRLGVEHGLGVGVQVDAGNLSEFERQLLVHRRRRRRAELERVGKDAGEHQAGYLGSGCPTSGLAARVEDAPGGAEGAHVELERRLGRQTAHLVVINDRVDRHLLNALWELCWIVRVDNGDSGIALKLLEHRWWLEPQ